jgi:hypothetical protein
MLFQSEIVTAASGSVGGVTYSHNRGGMYRRARAVPVNPNSVSQVAVRANVATLAFNWSSVLTEVQRESWRTYSAAVPLAGPLGDLRDIGGEAMYIRCNSARMRAGLAQVAAAPAALNEGEAVLNGVLTATVALGLSVAFTNPTAAVESIIIQQGRTVQGGVLFFGGPFRFAFVETPPLTPAALAFASVPFSYVAGQKVFIRARYTHTDGRLGPASILSDIAA